MELIFLGTSSGVPTKTRNVSACIIKKRHSKSWCLVDCGEGTQHRLLHTSMTLHHLDAIFITHVHGDHCYGLPGLLASAAMSGRRKSLTIVAPTPIELFIKTSLEVSDTTLTYDIVFIDVTSLSSPLDITSFTVEPVELSHRVPCFAYVFKTNDSYVNLDKKKLEAEGISPGPLWGKIKNAGKNTSLTTNDGTVINPEDYVIKRNSQRSIIIGGDNDTPELLAKYAKTANVLVHEATFTEIISQKVGPTPQHSSAKRVAQFAESTSIKNLVLTHFSSRYSDINQKRTSKGSIGEIEDEAREFYSGELFLAEDLATYYLDDDGKLLKHPTQSQITTTK